MKVIIITWNNINVLKHDYYQIEIITWNDIIVDKIFEIKISNK